MAHSDPEARRQYSREWYARNREDQKRKAAERRAANRETIRAANRRWNERNPGYHADYYEKNRAEFRNRRYRKEYGISLAQYEEMLAKQGGRCAICGGDGASGRGGKMHVDHDHATGRVRELLCHSCNTKLGWLEAHGPDAMAYLLKHSRAVQ